jgi:predicted RNA binding protein YcfA (HicA-like mRNA interferase family)
MATGFSLFRIKASHRQIQRTAVPVPPVTGEGVVALPFDTDEREPIR